MIKKASKTEETATFVDDKSNPEMTISILYAPTQEPKVVFTGNWTGRDFKIVLFNLRRAYYRHQQNVHKQSRKLSE